LPHAPQDFWHFLVIQDGLLSHSPFLGQVEHWSSLSAQTAGALQPAMPQDATQVFAINIGFLLHSPAAAHTEHWLSESLQSADAALPDVQMPQEFWQFSTIQPLFAAH